MIVPRTDPAWLPQERDDGVELLTLGRRHRQLHHGASVRDRAAYTLQQLMGIDVLATPLIPYRIPQ
jgi:hypothetical protein